jgi:hypothetical protein
MPSVFIDEQIEPMSPRIVAVLASKKWNSESLQLRKLTLLVGLLVLGIVAVVFFSRADKETQLVTDLEQTPAPPRAEPFHETREHSGIVAVSSSTAPEGPKMAFELADDETKELNSLWLASEYSPYMDQAEFHIRSTFVNVDPDGLRSAFQDTYESNGGFIEPGANSAHSDSDIVFPLFPDVSVRATLVHLKVGRHSGIVTARFKTVRQESDYMGNTDNIYIEITSEGVVSGIVDTPDGMYRIRPTPTQDVLVVSEMDSESVYGSLKVN